MDKGGIDTHYQELFWKQDSLTEDQYICLYVKDFTSDTTDPTLPPFCGNCWRSRGTSRMCLSFFVILTCGFVAMSALMILYIRYRRMISSSDSYWWSYYKVFVFILAMLVA